jgi:TP901 family phage tail tape measure protein
MADLAATAGQAGVSYKDLAGFMQTAAKTSSAWDVSAKDAAQTLAEVRAQTNWSNKELADFADKVNFVGDISAAAEKDVGAMWQRASAGAKAANVSYDDSIVALTALRSVGMDQEVAARFFGQFTSRLRTATAQGKDAAAAFKLLGTSAQAVEKGMKTDSMKTMIDVIERIAKSKDGVKAALGIGGKEWFDEILRAKEALPELKRIRDALATGAYRGSLDKSLKEDLATTNNHLERTKALASEVGDNLMRWALPPINEHLEKLIKGYETAQKTGFLPGPDGGPIDRLKDKTPVPFSEANRRLFLRGVPQGESVDAFERRIRVNQNATPMMTQIEGAAPHLNLQQINAEKANVVAAGNQMKDALSFTASPHVDTGSAMAAIDALLAKVNALKAALASIGGAAASAGSSVDALSSKVGAASAKVGSLRAQQNAQFGASGQKGE